MSRRVSLFGVILVVVIWCGVLFTPSLRLMLRGQVTPVMEQAKNRLQRQMRNLGLSSYGTHNQQSQQEDSFRWLLREHPNDPRVLAEEAESLHMMQPGNDPLAGLRRYDELIEQFPNELWLIQNRLRLSTTGGLSLDIGEFATPQRRRDTKTWLSREEILQALKIAELGAQRDPQNSFYDWMRAFFLFALEQPEDALRVLANGAKKPRFDDGILRDIQNRIQVQEMQGPLLWEERLAIVAGELFPHLAVIGEITRAAIWRGVLAERSGNHRRALEIYGNQMKLAITMRRDSTSLITQLVAEALLSATWGGLTRELKDRPSAKTLEQKRHELSRAFANYAQKHGRPDLAQTALQQARELEQTDLRNTIQPDYLIGAEKMSTIKIFGQSQWVGAILMRSITVLAVVWIILSIVSLKVHGARALLSPLDVLASTLFCTVTTAIVYSVALRLGITREDFLGFGFLSDEDMMRYLISYFETILLWMPFVLAVLYCGAATLWRARKSPRLPLPNSQEPSVAERGVTAQIKSGLLFSANLLGILALCYLAVLWTFWLLNLPSIGINNEIYFLMLGPLVLAALVAFLWRRRATHIINWPYMLAWCRSSLGALVVVGSVVYLSTLLWVLPLRRAADARLDDYIARGEVAVLRDIAARQKE